MTPLALAYCSVPVAKEASEGTLLEGVHGEREKFGPLKAVLGSIPTLYANHEVRLNSPPKLLLSRTRLQKAIAVNKRIENLLSRVVSLEECFNSLPIDETDQRRRFESIRYVAVLFYSRYSFPSSKLNAVGEQLQLLSENQGLPRLTDYVQDDDNLFRSLDDLQEAIFDYRVRSQPRNDALFNINEDSR